jgi:hypothetical protein
MYKYSGELSLKLIKVRLLVPLSVLFIVLISILPSTSVPYVPTKVMAQKGPDDTGGTPDTGGGGAGGSSGDIKHSDSSGSTGTGSNSPHTKTKSGGSGSTHIGGGTQANQGLTSQFTTSGGQRCIDPLTGASICSAGPSPYNFTTGGSNNVTSNSNGSSGADKTQKVCPPGTVRSQLNEGPRCVPEDIANPPSGPGSGGGGGGGGTTTPDHNGCPKGFDRGPNGECSMESSIPFRPQPQPTTCPSGQHWDSNLNMCIKDGGSRTGITSGTTGITQQLQKNQSAPSFPLPPLQKNQSAPSFPLPPLQKNQSAPLSSCAAGTSQVKSNGETFCIPGSNTTTTSGQTAPLAEKISPCPPTTTITNSTTNDTGIKPASLTGATGFFTYVEGCLPSDIGQVTKGTPPRPPRNTALIITKLIFNDDGGVRTASDFTFFINNNNRGTGGESSPSVRSPRGASSIIVLLEPGSFRVSEDYHPGYDTVFSQGCSGTLRPGAILYCYIINDDEPTRAIRPPAHQGNVVITKRIMGTGTAMPMDFIISVYAGQRTTSLPCSLGIPGLAGASPGGPVLPGCSRMPAPIRTFPAVGHPGLPISLPEGSFFVVDEQRRGGLLQFQTLYSDECWTPGGPGSVIEAGDTRYCNIYNIPREVDLLPPNMDPERLRPVVVNPFLQLPTHSPAGHGGPPMPRCVRILDGVISPARCA